MRSLVAAAFLLAASAGSVRAATGLEVVGVPADTEPLLQQRLAAELGYQRDDPLATSAQPAPWFWQRRSPDLQIRVVFSRFYASTYHRTLFPLVAARYAYQVTAEGTACLFDPHGDSLLAALPFEFSWERPVHYQFLGIQPEAASVKVSSPVQYRLEAEAMAALTTEIARKIRRARQQLRED